MNCFVLSQWHLAKAQVSFGCEVITMNGGVSQYNLMTNSRLQPISKLAGHSY